MLITMNAGIGRGAVMSTFDGVFTTSSSVANISTPTRTYTRGAGNTGNLKFSSLSIGGTSFFYNKNGTGLVEIFGDEVINLATSDTLLLRATGLPSPGSSSVDLIDTSTGNTIENVVISRT